MRNDDLSVPGVPDPQLVRSDWSAVDVEAIDGVETKQMANVMTGDGYLTEMWRSDWELDDAGIDQVFQRVMFPGALSAWHTHLVTVDRLFAAVGHLQVVLFDARRDSPTHGAVAQFRIGEVRPAVIVVPPGVYHGVRNIGPATAILLNAVNKAYDYEAPDHHRLPADSPDIPFRW